MYRDITGLIIAGCKLIKEVFTSNEFSEKIRRFKIEHLSICLHSPWFGSIWDGMIITINLCIYKTIGRFRINYFDLRTIFLTFKILLIPNLLPIDVLMILIWK